MADRPVVACLADVDAPSPTLPGHALGGLAISNHHRKCLNSQLDALAFELQRGAGVFFLG